MIDTDKIDNMKQWTNNYKVRMFWDLVAEIKRLREGIDDLLTTTIFFLEATDPVYLQGFVDDLRELLA